MGVDLSDVNVDLGGSLGSVGPVTVAGIPSNFTINIPSLPKVTLGIDPSRSTRSSWASIR